MTYQLNGKNLAVARMMPRGPKADKRLKYVHVSSRGTACLTPSYLVRVSLPDVDSQPTGSVIYPQKMIDELPAEHFEHLVRNMPEGKVAVTGPEWFIPKFEQMIPTPQSQTASITLSGELLLKMLKIAVEVSEDSQKTLRLRICDGKLRVDNYRQEGDQEFLGVLSEIAYEGGLIPGDVDPDKHVTEVKPMQKAAVLKRSEGRRFRG